MTTSKPAIPTTLHNMPLVPTAHRSRVGTAPVEDAPLVITAETIAALSDFRDADKFIQLPGADTAEERERLTVLLNGVLDKLVAEVGNNPSRRWALSQFVPALEQMIVEDTEAREHFGMHLETIMDILGIESSDGLLGSYL